MRIASTRFGPLEVAPEDLLEFPRGLVGFPHWRRFVWLPALLKPPFQLLQSADDPDLALVAIDPRAVEPSYVARVALQELAVIGITTPQQAEQAWVLALVTLGSDPARATANLRAPLIINPPQRLGAQVILEGCEYAIRHPLVPAAQLPQHPAGRRAVVLSAGR